MGMHAYVFCRNPLSCFFLAGQCLFKFSRTFSLLNRLRNYKSNILGFIHFYPKKKLFCNVSCCIYLCCVVNKVMMHCKN